jgi:hypothetical protein
MIAKNKSDYIRLLCKYKTRRAEVKAKYQRGDPEYKQKVKKINTKIGTYKNAINRIDNINVKIKALNSRVVYKYGVSLYKAVKGGKEVSINTRRLRKMFCKYLIEQGIPNLYISQFIGWENKRATIHRRQFTRAMQKDEKLLAEWQVFKKAMRRELKYDVVRA